VAGYGNFEKNYKSLGTWQVSEIYEKVQVPRNVAGSGNLGKNYKSPKTWQVMETLIKKTSPQERGRLWKL
jgi:hypothetical protein